MFSILWKPDVTKKDAFNYEANTISELVDKLTFLIKVYNDLKRSGLLVSDYHYMILVENFITGSWEEWKDEETGITDPMEFIKHISKETNKKSKRSMRTSTSNRNIV